MLVLLLFCLSFVTPALSKPRYTDLDEEDQQLFRAVFDTPSYDHEEYEDDHDFDKMDMIKGFDKMDMMKGFDKMDMLKDGLWVVKAKLAELKAFNKALVFNFLSTKMKIKDLITNLPAKHHHASFDKKKQMHHVYSQPPAYYPHIPQYEIQPAQPQHGYDPYYGH